MFRLLKLALLSGLFLQSCGDKDAYRVGLLSSDEVAKFPEESYELDSLHMVYSDSVSRDTFLLFGDKLKQYIVSDGHPVGDGYTTHHEIWEKRFESMNGNQFLQLEMTTDQDDDIVEDGGILFTTPNIRLPISFDRISRADSDQVLKVDQIYAWASNDSIIYNIRTGVKSIKIRRGNVKYDLNFYR